MFSSGSMELLDFVFFVFFVIVLNMSVLSVEGRLSVLCCVTFSHMVVVFANSDLICFCIGW